MKRWSRGSITHIIRHQILCWRWESEKWKQLKLKLEVREIEKVFGNSSLSPTVLRKVQGLGGFFNDEKNLHTAESPSP